MAIKRSLAKRYSKALVATAVEDSKLKLIEMELSATVEFLKSMPELRSVLLSPVVNIQSKLLIANDVLNKLDIKSPVKKLITLLIESHRIDHLQAIAETFIEEVNCKRGIVSGELFTTAKIDADEIFKLQNSLSEKLNKKVTLEQKVEPSLIGGILVRVGGVIIDGSIRGRMDALKNTINKV